MSNPFYEHPVLNSPYDFPKRHWELDKDGQPTQKIIDSRRRAEFISPIPKRKKRRDKPTQEDPAFEDGEDDPLHLVVELKGYRGEDAKAKKSTMDNYWVPGANNSGKFGRWAFAEFTEVYEIEKGIGKLVESTIAKKVI